MSHEIEIEAPTLSADADLDSILGSRLELPDLIGALSYALDLTEGQPPGHCLRCTWIGMNVGAALGLDRGSLHDTYYGILLKDAGCSSNAARLCQLYANDDREIKRGFKTIDAQNLFQVTRFVFRHTSPDANLAKRLERFITIARRKSELATEVFSTRCERGADIARRLGFRESVAQIVRCLDEHHNGKGSPAGTSGDGIPVGSRIALLAQVVDVFHQTGGKHSAANEVSRRAGSWFDPRIVEAFREVAGDPEIWRVLESDDLPARVRALAPCDSEILVDLDRFESISSAFALVVDAKSPFTFGHSTRVADYAVAICDELGFESTHTRLVRCAALLHDLGKLGVSNSILDKPGRLTDAEFGAIRTHAELTEEILTRIPGLERFARLAAAHHERLDGSGYPRGLSGDEIALETRILAVADVFDALTAKRPYREALALREALEIMERDRGRCFDPVCLDALDRALTTLLPEGALLDPHYVMKLASP